MKKRYNIYGQDYATAGYIKVAEGCAAVIAINKGDEVAWFNGVRLDPSPAGPPNAGDSFSFSGNADEVFDGRLELRFAGTGLNPLVIIVQKFFL